MGRFLAAMQKGLRHFCGIRTFHPSGWYLMSRFCNPSLQITPFQAAQRLKLTSNSNDLPHVKHNARLSFF
jgi:hypothetical protein